MFSHADDPPPQAAEEHAAVEQEDAPAAEAHAAVEQEDAPAAEAHAAVAAPGLSGRQGMRNRSEHHFRVRLTSGQGQIILSITSE